MKSKGLSKALFAIQLKVNQEVIDIEVMEGDDQNTLTDRVCKDNRIGTQYKKLLQGKIIDSLLRIVQEQKISPALRDKVQKFIKKKTQQQETPPATLSTEPMNVNLSSMIANSPAKQESRREKIENIVSPVRQTVNKRIQDSEIASQIKPEEKTLSPNQYKAFHCLSHLIDLESKKNIKVTESKIEPPPAPVEKKTTAGIRKQSAATKTEKPTVKSKISEKPKRRTTEADQDLVKAYKIVAAKCKDPQMKEMAKKYLYSLSDSFVQEQERKPAFIKQQHSSIHLSNNQKTSSFKRSPNKNRQVPKQPQVSSFEEMERTKRLLALQQNQLDLEKPYQRRYADRPLADPVEQPYERRYNRQSTLNRSPYEFLSKTMNRTSTSTGNIYSRSIQASPYQPPTSINRMTQQRANRSYAPVSDHSRSIGSSSGTYTKRYRYLQEY